MINRNAQFKVVYTIVVLVASITLLLDLSFDGGNSILAYNRNSFHFWQLLTTHFVHYGLQHLLLNMLALITLIYVFPVKPYELIRGFVLAIILIDIYLLMSMVKVYVGFSGLLYVFPGIAVVRFIQMKRYRYLLIIIAVYLVFTFYSLNSVHTSVGLTWYPLIQAHILGFLGGIVSTLFSSKGTNPLNQTIVS